MPATAHASSLSDTSPEMPATDVHPLVHRSYDGRDLVLPDDPSAVLRASEIPELAAQLGNDIVTAAPGGVAGDYNNNGTVDAADYVVWRDNQNTNNTLQNNSLPGPIGQAHYDQWRANFGKASAVGAIGQAGDVPEPGAAALAAFAALVAVGGCFVASASWLMRRQALVPLRDPRLAESLAFENV